MVKLEFEDWKDAQWVINCAMQAIEDHFGKQGVRYNEMVELYFKLNEQLYSQINKEVTNIKE
jgi:hypothetical protein